ncbi:MAG: purple acid phosphatase [Acidobacteriota bacterium]|nr:MAG: purple acid phosphatase [Acidobacteriota bacterium]
MAEKSTVSTQMKSSRQLIQYALLTLFLSTSSLAQSLTRGPYLQMGETNGKTGAYISWYTDSKADSRVDLSGPEGIRQSFKGPAEVTHHIVHISDLVPATTYSYSIFSNGRRLAEGLTFNTAVDDDRPIRFAVFGDSGEGSIAQHEIANQVDSNHPDFVLHTGDVIYSNGSDRDYPRKFYEPYATILPYAFFMPTLGNHDDNVSDGKPYLENFILPHGEVDSGPISPEENYSFDWGNLHLVSLNTNRLETAPERFEQEVLPWLREDLLRTTKPWKMVYCHYPPYTDSRKDSDFEQLIEMLVPILQEAGVDVVFNGHSHNYQRFKPLWNSQVSAEYGKEGILYVLTGAGGTDLDSVRASSRLAAWNAEEHSFTLVDVNGTSLRLRQITRSGQTIDDFTLRKQPSNLFSWMTPEGGTTFLHLDREFTGVGFARLERSAESPRNGLAWIRQESSVGLQSLTPVGTQLSRKSHHFFVQEDSKIMTNLSIINSSSTTASVEIELFDSRGLRRSVAEVPVGPFKQITSSLLDLVPSLSLPFEGLVSVGASEDVSVFSVRSIRIPSGVNLAAFPQFREPTEDLAIPFLPTDTLLQGQVVLANPSSSRTSGSLLFTEYGSGKQRTRSYDIPPDGSLLISTQFLGTGIWRVELDPDGSTIPAFCAILQIMRGTGDLLQSVLMPRPPAQAALFPVEIAGNQTVSFAINNPSGSTASVELVLRDTSGETVGNRVFDLEPDQGQAFYLPELIEEAATLFRGSLEIKSKRRLLSEAFLSVKTDSLTLVSVFPPSESSQAGSPLTIPLVAFMKDGLRTDLWLSNPDNTSREEQLRLFQPANIRLSVFQRY